MIVDIDIILRVFVKSLDTLVSASVLSTNVVSHEQNLLTSSPDSTDSEDNVLNPSSSDSISPATMTKRIMRSLKIHKCRLNKIYNFELKNTKNMKSSIV